MPFVLELALCSPLSLKRFSSPKIYTRYMRVNIRFINKSKLGNERNFVCELPLHEPLLQMTLLLPQCRKCADFSLLWLLFIKSENHAGLSLFSFIWPICRIAKFDFFWEGGGHFSLFFFPITFCDLQLAIICREYKFYNSHDRLTLVFVYVFSLVNQA